MKDSRLIIDRIIIEREMTYTTWEQSCKDPALHDGGEFRECRRQAGHQPPHASGFGRTHLTW